MKALLHHLDTTGQVLGFVCLGPVLIIGMLSPVLVPALFLGFAVVGGWR